MINKPGKCKKCLQSVLTNQQNCLSNMSCSWVQTSPKKGFCRTSEDADIIALLMKQKKINQSSSPQEVKMAVYLYKKGISSCL